jgi:hypothetical protein
VRGLGPHTWAGGCGSGGIRAAPIRSAPRGRAERRPTHARARRPPARAFRRGMSWYGRRHGTRGAAYLRRGGGVGED